MLRPLLLASEFKEHGGHHFEGDSDHLGGDPIASLLLQEDLVLPRRHVGTAVCARPRPTGKSRIEDPALPRHRDRQGLSFPLVVFLSGGGAHQMRSGEVSRIPLAWRVGVKPRDRSVAKDRRRLSHAAEEVSGDTKTQKLAASRAQCAGHRRPAARPRSRSRIRRAGAFLLRVASPTPGESGRPARRSPAPPRDPPRMASPRHAHRRPRAGAP